MTDEELNAIKRANCEARERPAPQTATAARESSAEVQQRFAALRRQQMEARDAASWTHLDAPPEAQAELDEQNAALGRTAPVILEG